MSKPRGSGWGSKGRLGARGFCFGGSSSKTRGTNAPICRRRIVCTACVCAGRIGGIGTLVFPDDYPRPGLLVWPAGPPSQRLNQYCRLSWTRTAAGSLRTHTHTRGLSSPVGVQRHGLGSTPSSGTADLGQMWKRGFRFASRVSWDSGCGRG